MNKILFLKILIGFMTLLIFLGMGLLVYGLLFYKKTPKLLSRPESTAAAPAPAAAAVPEIRLGVKGGRIADALPCGDFLCVRLSSDFNDDIITVIDPKTMRVTGRIHPGEAQ